MKAFPCIDMLATGTNIKKLRTDCGLTVRDLQDYFGFEQPQAIYKWQWGECLPSIDNLYALSKLFRIPIDKILVGDNEDFHLLAYANNSSFYFNTSNAAVQAGQSHHLSPLALLSMVRDANSVAFSAPNLSLALSLSLDRV